MAQFTLTLNAITDGSARPAWTLDGHLIGDPIPPAASADVSREFRDLFEQPTRPRVDAEVLRSLGRRLFDRFFAPIRGRLTGPGHDLLIRSADGHLLNLPWELVELTPDLPLGCDAAWSLRRTHLAELAKDAPLIGGPLRLLFLATAPADQPQLDYEREEDALQQIASRLRGDVVLRFAEMGSFEELRALVAEVQPHVLHLSGHGVVGTDGVGRFAFEDERGRTDLWTSAELADQVLRGRSVRCVFLNACQSSQAAAAGLCQGLVAAGVPLALGWAASVIDDTATDFVADLYKDLLRGEPLPPALSRARALLRKKGRTANPNGTVLQDATFALPQLYCSTQSGNLYDPALPRLPYRGPQTVRTLLPNGIKGLKEGFVGRRRQLQQLVPALRDGDVSFAVLTGLGGAGKSTLATRAANRLAEAGFRVVAVHTLDGGTPEERGRKTLSDLIAALERAFIQEQREDLRGQLTDGRLTLETRLRLAIEGLNGLRLLIVLDNFEYTLDLERRIADPDLAGCYRALTDGLVSGSRVLLTCRYLPADTPGGRATVLHLPLPDLEEHNFLKFLSCDKAVNARIQAGELSDALLSGIYRRVGGTPRFLERVRTLLQNADATGLADQLDEDAADGPLDEGRERYLEEILAGRLYDAMPADARALASRLAVSELPIPADAASSLGGLDAPRTAAGLEAAVAYGLLQEFADPDLSALYHPPGLLRPWLVGKLSTQGLRNAHAELARYWRQSREGGRGSEMWVSPVTVLTVCREHARLAEDWPTLCWATVKLSILSYQAGDWCYARELMAGIPEAMRDEDCLMTLARIEVDFGNIERARGHLRTLLASSGREAVKGRTWLQLGRIDLDQRDYAGAADKFRRAGEIARPAGDAGLEASVCDGFGLIALAERDYAGARAQFEQALALKWGKCDQPDAADTLSMLARIDFVEGGYAEARERFSRAMEIHQSVNDRLGEAEAWYWLGALASKMGRRLEGIRLLALSRCIEATVRHADDGGQQERQGLLEKCCKILGYDADQTQAVLAEAARSYRHDRGRALLEAAFPPGAPS